MLSHCYHEFLEEEDYWFLNFTVGGTSRWGGIMRLGQEKKIIALLEAFFVKVNEILIFFLEATGD